MLLRLTSPADQMYPWSLAALAEDSAAILGVAFCVKDVKELGELDIGVVGCFESPIGVTEHVVHFDEVVFGGGMPGEAELVAGRADEAADKDGS